MKTIILALLILSIQSHSKAESSASSYDQAKSRFQSNIGNTSNMKFFWDEIIDITFRATKNSDLVDMVKEWESIEKEKEEIYPSETGAIKLISYDDSITAKLSPSQVPTNYLNQIDAAHLLCDLHKIAIGNDDKNAIPSSRGFTFTLKFENKTNLSKSIFYFCSTTSCEEKYNRLFYNCFSEDGNAVIKVNVVHDDWD